MVAISSILSLAVLAATAAAQSTGKTTRYWDCCKSDITGLDKRRGEETQSKRSAFAGHDAISGDQYKPIS